jgi:hypothetical protein
MNARVPTPKENEELALNIIRLVSRNLKAIDQEVTTIGSALSQRRMPPGIALQLVNQIAPGCVNAVYLSLFEGVSPEQLSNVFAEPVCPAQRTEGAT